MTLESTAALLSVVCLAQFILIVIQWSAIRGWKDTVEHLAGCLKRSHEREDIWKQAFRESAARPPSDGTAPAAGESIIEEFATSVPGHVDDDPFAHVGKQPASQRWGSRCPACGEYRWQMHEDGTGHCTACSHRTFNIPPGTIAKL